MWETVCFYGNARWEENDKGTDGKVSCGEGKGGLCRLRLTLPGVPRVPCKETSAGDCRERDRTK